MGLLDVVKGLLGDDQQTYEPSLAEITIISTDVTPASESSTEPV